MTRHFTAGRITSTSVRLPTFPYNRRVSVTVRKRMENFDSRAVKVILFDVYGRGSALAH